MFTQSKEDFKDNKEIYDYILEAEVQYASKDYAAAISSVNHIRRMLIESGDIDFKDSRYVNICSCLGRILNEYAKAKQKMQTEIPEEKETSD